VIDRPLWPILVPFLISLFCGAARSRTTAPPRQINMALGGIVKRSGKGMKLIAK
jgi:hypothetical protein